MLGGGGKKDAAAAQPKGKGRKTAVSSDEEEEEVDEDQDSEDDPLPPSKKKSATTTTASKPTNRGRLSNLSAASTSSARSSRRDSMGTPLVRLGKTGKEVKLAGGGDRKGKGKMVEQEEESEEEYFGGGGEEGEYDLDQEGEQSMDQDREEESASEEEEEEQPAPKKSKSTGKGKGKARSSTSASPQKGGGNKSSKTAAATAARKAQAEARKKGETVVSSKQAKKRMREVEEDEEGVRRSSRQRLQPLEYWRNERVVYKRRQSGIAIEEVVRIPKPPAESLASKKKNGGGGGPRSGSTKVRVKSEPAPPEEEGVDDATDPDGIVWSWEGNAEVSRRIAFTAKMVDPRPTYNNKFMFQKIYTELDYLAGGILQIPAGAEKPTKPAKDNSYMFYCIEGSVSVVVHRTRFAIGPGATFFVPRGNSYSISATSNRDVKLFFTQGRRVIENDDGTTRPDTLEDSRRVSLGGQREEEESGSEEGSGSEEE
ncbi:Mif2/CENP-C like-domain-containing protein [Leucosporidium creatinivorum]|uniref:CENP-C homolog n=1 Tax=Leucosporidium creatinivorum TaxID=106004 RepID=A0A1Y2EM16_9BASI|nr:Mif2/CENP-C like-domain-containing protein [Leucosporidium creatinivorum]